MLIAKSTVQMDFDYVSTKLKIKPTAARMRYSRLKRAVFKDQGAASKGKTQNMVMDGDSP